MFLYVQNKILAKRWGHRKHRSHWYFAVAKLCGQHGFLRRSSPDKRHTCCLSSNHHISIKWHQPLKTFNILRSLEMGGQVFGLLWATELVRGLGLKLGKLILASFDPTWLTHSYPHHIVKRGSWRPFLRFYHMRNKPKWRLFKRIQVKSVFQSPKAIPGLRGARFAAITRFFIESHINFTSWCRSLFAKPSLFSVLRSLF